MILHLVRENQDFHIKNKCVFTLHNLAFLINKQLHTSINLRKGGRVRKSSAVRYFTLPQCGAVQGFSNARSLVGLTWYHLLCTHRSETTPNILCPNMEVNKDVVCAVVLKIGLVYIPGMPSKEVFFAGIYRKCGNSPTLNVNINKSIRSHFRTIAFLYTSF